MFFNTGAALLDAVVLAVVSKEKEGTYGYKITQDVRGVLDVSESTLYPVLRRLQKDDYDYNKTTLQQHPVVFLCFVKVFALVRMLVLYKMALCRRY